MVERYKDKPFAFLGVNNDQGERFALQKKLKDQGVTYRNFMDGLRGPIAKAWNIQGFPTVYVIDAKGVIRMKSVGGDSDKLDKAVEEALKDAE